MDLKGPIVDTKIKIKPSQQLIQYIKNIPFKDDIPANIAKIIKGSNYELVKGVSDITVKVHLDLSSHELDVIKEIVTDSSEGHETKQCTDQSNTKTKTNIIKESTKSKRNDGEKVDESDEEQRLTVGDIDWLYAHLQQLRSSSDQSIPYLHELLEGSDVETPDNEVLKRNPALEARCVKLRSQQEAREYRAMTKGVDNVRIRFPEDSISYQLKQLNRQLIAVGQFLLSIFAGFLFGFKGIELMIGGIDFGVRLLLGVMCALIIALAEIYFLAKKLNEELSIPETTQLGGPPKFANHPDAQTQPNAKQVSKEHQD